MDQQGQNGLMTTFREGWRNQGIVAFLISAVLFAFYGALYFTDAGGAYYEALDARSAIRGLVLLGALIAVLGGVYTINKKTVT